MTVLIVGGDKVQAYAPDMQDPLENFAMLLPHLNQQLGMHVEKQGFVDWTKRHEIHQVQSAAKAIKVDEASALHGAGKHTIRTNGLIAATCAQQGLFRSRLK